MGVAETRWPRRTLISSKFRRWTANLSVVLLSTGLTRLLFPVLPVATAIHCKQHGYGLFNLLEPPAWLAIPAGILLLDLVIYWQHVAFHRHRLLWRVHRMHHADIDIDASTALRFHPIEIIMSMALKLGVVFLLGPPPVAVIIFEILLNGCAIFNHANVTIPLAIDRWLRLLVVTPDMHRVHHSTDMREANRNYGFSFPWWDRMFSTYKPQPEQGHKGMQIGLNIFREPSYTGLFKLLAIPFL